MKRILFVDHASRILGGAEINLIELLDNACGHWDAACACAPDSPLRKALLPLGVRLHDHAYPSQLNELRLVERRLDPARMWQGLAAVRNAASRLERVIRELAPQAVVSCANKDHFTAGLACRRAGVPSLWWINDAFTPEFFSAPVRFAFTRAASLLAARLVPVSHFARRALLANGLPPRLAATIHNGIPLERYAGRERGALRTLLGLDHRARLAGIIGRFTPWKGQDLFLRLAQRCALEFADVHFVLVGQAFNEDQEYEAELRRFVNGHGLETRIHFVHFQHDVAATLADLDVLVHASVKPEPFGRVIIEAMAAGVPVIAANAGGALEIVKHDSNGLLATPGEPAEYHAQLRRLLDSPDEARRLSDAARRTVRERFGIDRVRAQFENLLEELA